MSVYLPNQFVRTEDRDRWVETEEMRCKFRARRMADLMAAGMSEDDAVDQVDAEVRNGAALQAQPVRVVRTKGDGNAD